MTLIQEELRRQWKNRKENKPNPQPQTNPYLPGYDGTKTKHTNGIPTNSAQATPDAIFLRQMRESRKTKRGGV